MNLGEFSRFLSDFKVTLKKENVLEVFRKAVENKKYLISFHEFIICLNNICVKLNEEKQDKLKKEIAKVRSDLKYLSNQTTDTKDTNVNKLLLDANTQTQTEIYKTLDKTIEDVPTNIIQTEPSNNEIQAIDKPIVTNPNNSVVKVNKNVNEKDSTTVKIIKVAASKKLNVDSKLKEKEAKSNLNGDDNNLISSNNQKQNITNKKVSNEAVSIKNKKINSNINNRGDKETKENKLLTLKSPNNESNPDISSKHSNRNISQVTPLKVDPTADSKTLLLKIDLEASKENQDNEKKEDQNLDFKKSLQNNETKTSFKETIEEFYTQKTLKEKLIDNEKFEKDRKRVEDVYRNIMSLSDNKTNNNNQPSVRDLLGRMTILGKSNNQGTHIENGRHKVILPGMLKLNANTLNIQLKNLRTEYLKANSKTFQELMDDLFVHLQFDDDSKVSSSFIFPYFLFLLSFFQCRFN